MENYCDLWHLTSEHVIKNKTRCYAELLGHNLCFVSLFKQANKVYLWYLICFKNKVYFDASKHSSGKAMCE